MNKTNLKLILPVVLIFAVLTVYAHFYGLKVFTQGLSWNEAKCKYELNSNFQYYIKVYTYGKANTYTFLIRIPDAYQGNGKYFVGGGACFSTKNKAYIIVRVKKPNGLQNEFYINVPENYLPKNKVLLSKTFTNIHLDKCGNWTVYFTPVLVLHKGGKVTFWTYIVYIYVYKPKPEAKIENLGVVIYDNPANNYNKQ